MTGLRPVSFKKGRASAPRLSPKREPGRTSDRFWTEEEEAILRKYFPIGGVPAAGAHLPNRSKTSIYGQAYKLGLKREGRATRQNIIVAALGLDDALRARWPEMTEKGDVRKLAEELNVPRWWLSQRARQLGLTVAHKKEPPWTAAEEALMRKAPLHNPDRCSEIFREHGFNRSPTSICVKAKRMSLSRRATRTTFSGTSAAKVLGLNNKTITEYCIAGIIKATRRGTKRLPQQGGDTWDIEPHDLRAFVLDNLASFDIRKVEKIAFVELLARCPRCEEKGR